MIQAEHGFVGHDRAWGEWRAALAGPRMHHGWIVAGRKGIGKAAFALQAARELVASDSGTQPAGDHPDIIVLTNLPATADDEKKRGEGKAYQVKRNITVEQIRAMQRRLTTQPTLGARRAIIIDSADDLEKSASNALLKSLEEPPAGSFFLLVSHRPGRLLPTIRSRCRMLAIPQLSPDEVGSVLAREAPEAEIATREAAIAASGGSPGAALEFVEQDLAKMHTLMRRITEEGDPAFVLRGKLAEEMGARPDRKRQLAALELAQSVVSGRVDGIAVSQIPAVVDTHADLVRLAGQAPTYNFDPGLLVMEIGTLLARVAASREAANG